MHSMTGYGRKQVEACGREVTLEIKTVNHRFLDISFRLPKRCTFLEDVLRKEVSAQLKRGHVDIFLVYNNTREDAVDVSVDNLLAQKYKQAVAQLCESLQCPNDVGASFFAQLPDVLKQTQLDENQEELKELAKMAAQEALLDVIAMREKEGEALKQDLLMHIEQLEDITKKIAVLAPMVPPIYREKMLTRIQEAQLEQVDPMRLAQEVAIWADRCAIDEELSRLNSHIEQMRFMAGENGETGRRLDFLTQELNREINTIGSKAADAEITKLVVLAKSEVEKLREQVQNVE